MASGRRPPSLTTQIPLAMGGGMALVGWVFFIMGCAFSWLFMPLVDGRGLWANAGAQESAPAEVKEVARTNVEVNGRRIHRVDYEAYVLVVLELRRRSGSESPRARARGRPD